MEAKTKKYLMYGGIVIAIIAVIFTINYLSIEAKRKEEKEERDKIIANSEVITNPDNSGNSTPSIDLNARNFTDRLYSDFHAYNADTSLYDELMKEDDKVIRAVWKDWDIRYKNAAGNKQIGKTLGFALYDAYAVTRGFTFGWDWTYHAKKFHDKLKALGLP